VFNGEDTPVTTAYSGGVPKDLPQHFGYDFLNADMLRALKVEGAGRQSRRSALPRHHARRDQPLHEPFRVAPAQGFGGRRRAGGGEKPLRSPGLSDDPGEFAREADALWSDPNIVASNDIEAAMVKLGISGLAGPCAFGVGLQFVHRILPDGDIYYVSNPGDQAVKADVAFRAGASMPQIWNARWPGTQADWRAEKGRSVVTLYLAPHDSRFVVFGKTGTPKAAVGAENRR
jgi:hypothetical protein